MRTSSGAAAAASAGDRRPAAAGGGRRVSRKLIAVAVLVLAAIAYTGFEYGAGAGLHGCGIKGNINQHGERIFHAPGSENYWRTRVNPLVGERWFCSVEAAQAAGWRESWR